MSQEDDNSAYIPLAIHLASECFLEHPSKDVRLLIACCIADVFRVFAPDAPYKDPEQLKVCLNFLCSFSVLLLVQIYIRMWYRN